MNAKMIRQITWLPERFLTYITFKWPLPVWVRRCTYKAPDSLKDFLHTSHVNGRSPVWMCRCYFKVLDRLKDFLHTSHLKGRSIVWVRRWYFKAPECLKNFLYTSQLYCCCPVMQLEVIWPNERFFKYITGKEPLPIMSAQMILQVIKYLCVWVCVCVCVTPLISFYGNGQ